MKRIKLFFLFLIMAVILGTGATVLAARESINPVPSLIDGGTGTPLCAHVWETTTTKAATCTRNGEKEKKCTKCGTIGSTEIISKLKHVYSEWGSNSTKHWKVCSVCGTSDSSSKASHDFPTGKCVCGMAEPKCTTDKLLLSHLTDWAHDFRNKTAETHDVITTCTKCKVSASSKKVKHYFGDGSGYCPCGYPKNSDTSVCTATNTVSGHSSYHKVILYTPTYDELTETSEYHSEIWLCSKCNERWSKEYVKHDFKSGKCACGYKKPSTVGDCSNGHRFYSYGTCKVCGVQLRVTGGSYSNWATWSSYSPYNSEPSWQSPVTITFNYAPYDENGKLISGTMSCTSFTRHNATWHSNVAKKYKLNESSYTTHLFSGGAIGGTTTVTGSTSGNTITFSGIPKGRCYTDVNLNGISVSIPTRRYTSGGNESSDPGPTDGPVVPDQEQKTYTVIARHVDLTTKVELSNPTYETVNEGDSKTVSKKNFDGYSYSYVEYPAGNRKYTDSVTITDIREDKEVTFYYSKELTVSVVHYDRSTGKVLTTETYSSPEKFKYNGSLSVSRLSDSLLKVYGTGYTYTNEFDISINGASAEKKTGESTTLYNITSYITVTFYYSKPAYVKVVGRTNSAPYTLLYENGTEKVEITPSGVNKSYVAKSVEGYECIGYTVEDTMTSNVENLLDEMKSGNGASVTLTASQTVKLITFIYKPISGINVKHVQVGPEKIGDTYKGILLKENLISAKPGETVAVENELITREGLLNYTIISVDGNVKNLQSGYGYTKTKYAESVTAASNRITEVIIYYVNPKVEIEHRFEDKNGNLKNSEKSEEKLDEKKNIPSKDLKGKDYVNKEAIVDGEVVEKVPPTPPTLKEKYTVSVEPDSPDNKTVVMIYVYQKQPVNPPSPGDKDESEYTPVTCDPTVNNSNVLVDSNVTIVIPNHGVHTDFGEDDYYNKLYADKKLVKFPFEVYYKGELQNKDTWIEVANRSDILKEGNSDGRYEIGIPAWIKEEKYTVDVRVIATSGTESNERKQSNDIFNKGAIAYNQVEINVVGKIYDFSVTNLEGDTIWSKYLFETKDKEYEANTLPIGQANVVPTSYKYGMKLGSTFLYSINTLGISNTKVQILPKVYYVEKNGGVAEDVTSKLQYKTEKGFVKFDSTAVNLSTKINKETRMTAEVRTEVSKSMAMKSFVGYGQDTNVLRKYGTYSKMLIDNSLRLPYVGYVSALTNSSDKNIDKVMTAANHWYAEYKLPNTLVMTTKENGEEKTVRKDGFYIVCFKIESKDANENTYLKYENQYVGNQWKNEGGANSELTIKLPLTAQTSNATTSIKVADGYYPVAIYQANISVSEDYEISGTH